MIKRNTDTDDAAYELGFWTAIAIVVVVGSMIAVVGLAL